ncbi:MAG: hypothetical protein H0W81_09835, partial [Chloroflexi bacterium]|nr:hypothetical protein [Chloroflexota bacterium]
MIGADRRRRAIVIGVGLAVGIGFGLRSPDPPHADPPGAAARAQLVADAADAAEDGLLRLG